MIDTVFIKIGIMPHNEFQQRVLKIAKGEYVPSKDEPKIWFDSIRSAAEVLSEENRNLLKMIVEHSPHSIKELSDISGRKQSNLSRTLKTMQSYGIVDFKKNGKESIPHVLATNFSIDMSIINAF